MSIHVSYNQPSQEIHSYDGKLSAVVQGSGNLTVEIHVTAGSWDTSTRLYYRQDDTEVEGLVNVSESNDQQYLLPCAYLATGTVRIALSNGGTTTNFMNINLTKVSSSEDPADDDPQFTLDNKKRLVLVPGSQNLLAIQFDNESEVVTFKFPRYQEGVDLSTKTPYVNYRRPQAGDLGKSLCTFDEIVDDTIYFSWLIDANVTNYEGTIKFQVEFSDQAGYRWQSQIGELPILTSIYNTGLEPYAPSFLETILNQMQGYARDSEAYAVGTRNGTPVTSGDPAYHRNAKYFADWFFESRTSPDAKRALLTLLSHVAYTDEHGQQYLQDLENELFETASVVSMTATFNQGQNVVYDTDSLETLRQYLTVMGTFDDLSVREITGYTLSGTLTEGTSTITVSYGGKTATFTVNVTHKLTVIDGTTLTWVYGFIGSNGNVDTNTSGAVYTSEYYDVSGYGTALVALDGATSLRNAYYTANKTFIKRELTAESEIPSNAVYARATVMKSELGTSGYDGTGTTITLT